MKAINILIKSLKFALIFFSISASQTDSFLGEIKIIYAKKPHEILPSRLFIHANKKSIRTGLEVVLEDFVPPKDIFLISPDTQNSKDTNSLFLGIKAVKNHFIYYRRYYYPNDCLIGSVSFISGMIFILFFGEDYKPSNPPSGIFANIGEHYVEDIPLSCFPVLFWFTGIYFGTKSFFEKFFMSGEEHRPGFEGILQKENLVICETIILKQANFESNEYFRNAVRKALKYAQNR